MGFDSLFVPETHKIYPRLIIDGVGVFVFKYGDVMFISHGIETHHTRDDFHKHGIDYVDLSFINNYLSISDKELEMAKMLIPRIEQYLGYGPFLDKLKDVLEKGGFI